MLRGILIIALYGVGAVLSLNAVAYACSYWIWSEIFRPVSFARYWVEFPAAHLVAAILLISIFIRKWDWRWNPVATVLAVLVGWTFLSTIFAQYRSVAMYFGIMQVKYLIPLILISISLTTRFAQNLFVWTLALSVGVYGAQAGLHCLLRGAADIGMSIAGGQMTDRNDFMVGVVASLPLIAYAGWHYSWYAAKWMRLACKAALLLSIAAIFLSLSRGAVVGLTALFFYYMVATGRFGRRVLTGVVVLACGLPFVPGFVTDRMLTVDFDTRYQSEGSARVRLQMLKVGAAMAAAHPIVGVGPGNFKYVAPTYGAFDETEPHTIWLKAAAEYGFPILILFVAMLLVLLRGLGRQRKRARARGDRETEMLATALACSIVGFCAAATFTSHFMSEYLWAVLAVSGALVAHQEHLRRVREPSTKVETDDSKLEKALVS